MRCRTTDGFWQDKCVIITGTSSGIGRALAQHVASHGAKVGLLARRVNRLGAVADELHAAGAKAVAVNVDVRDATQVREGVGRIESQLGACDVMIASAGIYRQTDGRRLDVSEAGLVVETNVLGVINAFGAVLPGMVERGRGHVAAVSSVSGLLGLPTAGVYCSTKAALVVMLRGLRLDLHSAGVKVTALCPGYVDTPLITDEERRTLKHLLSAAEAARRMCWAIERGRAEYWFPWQTWLAARLAGTLPHSIYRRLMALLPEMEETNPDLSPDDADASTDLGSKLQPDDTGQNQTDTQKPDRAG